jgi:hypothetical protein
LSPGQGAKSAPNPAPKRKRGKPDEPFTPFKEALSASWKFKNPALEMPWGAGEAGQLVRMLRENPLM